MNFRWAAVAIAASALALSSCGGNDYPNADPAVASRISNSDSCDTLDSIANAWNARYESYDEGAARNEARETFLLAADKLADLDCPGW